MIRWQIEDCRVEGMEFSKVKKTVPLASDVTKTNQDSALAALERIRQRVRHVRARAEYFSCASLKKLRDLGRP